MATRAFSFVIALAMILWSAGVSWRQAQSQLFETRARRQSMIDAAEAGDPAPRTHSLSRPPRWPS